jgi:ATP-dependent Clp protease protease subunit
MDAKEEKSAASAGADRLADRLAFDSRFVMVFGQIDHAVAKRTVERLIALSHVSDEPIKLLISSPGGHVESGDAIHDMIKFIKAPVITIGTGWVASAGTHIYLAAEKANRVCLPNTRFMIHQPSGGAGGPATDIAIQAREILRTRERIAQVVADATGHPLDKVMLDMERDHWMSANDAIAYGIVSRIIQNESELV